MAKRLTWQDASRYAGGGRSPIAGCVIHPKTNGWGLYLGTGVPDALRNSKRASVRFDAESGSVRIEPVAKGGYSIVRTREGATPSIAFSSALTGIGKLPRGRTELEFEVDCRAIIVDCSGLPDR